ncbi:MAG: hypothetical protein JWO22_2474 [Frankiales bacterium]|nr:hypothetical protein [Frankiales bacterium]
MEDALAWAADNGVTPVGEVTQPRTAVWSTALRIPTRDGVVWLKAGGAGTRYEAGLVKALVEMGAPHLLTPLAIDVERGWLLLPDGGPTLRSVLDRDPDVSHWEKVLPGYAELQRHAENRVLPGVPDHRPQRMPAVLAELLETQPVEHREELEALQPRFAEWCDELATSGIAPTVNHDDLHDNNVFSSGVLFDWGDADLAFPFTSLLVTLRAARSRWPDLDLRRLRDAYLEPWTDSHSRAELELLALLATRVGKVGRSHAWVRALTGVPDPGEHREAAPGWLEELFEEDVF